MPQNVRPQEIRPDPILTAWAVQFGTGGGFIQDIVAPAVDQESQYYKFATYIADELNREIKTEVGPGGKPNLYRVGVPTFTTGATKRYALDGQINREIKLLNMGPLAKEQVLIRKIVHNLKLDVELALRAILDATTYQAAPSVKWDATSGTIAIEKNIDDAKEAFELACGLPATHLIMPRAVANVVKRDPSIRGLRKFTDDNLLLNGDLTPEIFGVPVIIPGAFRNTANTGLAQTIGRLWSADACYLVHVNPSISADGETMTAFAQMRWSQWGSPYSAYSWADPHQSVKTDWVSVDVHQKLETIAPQAMYRLDHVLTTATT